MKKKKQQKLIQPAKVSPSFGMKGRLPIVKFFAVFILGIVLFYLFYYSDWYETQMREGLLSFQAKLGGGILNILGYGVNIQKEIISNANFSMSIKNGCDGLEATAIFLSAVLAFPTAFRLKVPGILLGFGVLFIANIIRIVGLFMVGIHWRSAFEFFHLHGGLVLFMFFALIVLLIWGNWALHQEKKHAVS